MTRGAHELAGEIKRQAKPVIAEVQVQLLDMLGLDAFLRPPPDLRRQRLDQVLRESERLAYVAQRALGAAADDGRAERGVIAAIGLEHPLHDALAPLMPEIHVDVSRLAPFPADATIENEQDTTEK